MGSVRRLLLDGDREVRRTFGESPGRAVVAIVLDASRMIFRVIKLGLRRDLGKIMNISVLDGSSVNPGDLLSTGIELHSDRWRRNYIVIDIMGDLL